jgi:hypothetical protein
MSLQSRMLHLIEETARWNSLRYDRFYDPLLTTELLNEETRETLEADTAEEYLDGCMDVAFVAIGAMWKHGVDPHGILAALDSNLPMSDDSVTAHLADYVNASFSYAESALNLTPDQVVDAYQIVCEANHTKSIKKTASHLKANDGDKGPYFRDPGPLLAKLIEESQDAN